MQIIKYSIKLFILLIPTIVLAQGTETRKLSAFSKLEISGSFDTFVEPGNEESIRIEALGIDPKKIMTEVNDKTLKVYLEKGDYNNIRTKVFITTKHLESISRSGSGDLNCKSGLSAARVNFSLSGSGDTRMYGKIKAKYLDFSLSGSGDTRMEVVEADDLNLSVSGSGDTYITSGYAKNQSITIAGSGDVHVYRLQSETCSVTIAGSGDAEVLVNKTLEGQIAGSGDISYKGTAVITKNKTAGSGEIRKM